VTENIAMIRVTETRRRRLGAALGVLAAVWCAAAPAAAQDETKAAATAAFDQAEQLKAAGKLADACLKYGESERLDPQLGTLLHLADCLEQNGQTASAWAAFREAQEVAEKRNDARQALAEDRVAKLSPHLSKLQINPPKSVDPSTLHVERDHVVVGSALWGAPVPTDPGTHTITVSAPGHHLWTGTAIVRSDGSTSTVDVPDLDVEVPSSPESSATPKSGVALASSTTAPPGTDNGGSSSMPTQTVLGISAIGAGVVGLVIGAVFEAQRSSKLSSRDAICPSGNDCVPSSQAQIDTLTSQARSASTAGTVGLVAGGVLAAGGVVLILTTPHHSSTQVSLAPMLSPRFQGLMLSGNIF
jgi:hypothetical protein